MDLPTPAKCTADFCLIPIGTASPSVSAQIADVQRLIEASGVKYTMHSAGTTLEGPWDRVHQVIGQAHTLLHQQGIVRIQTDIRVGSRYVLLYPKLAARTPSYTRYHSPKAGSCSDDWIAVRTDKEQTAEDKVNKVCQLLRKDL
ncbi:hypothetical protein N7532_008995 [Penicillium argentinense]|uniref:Thiamine-binding protein domain-containing protein n=1 Tax=Penicillium argentinense TaxID=1131581 RepID=A0A9W9EYP6_9EURO|nr:uncharacterized protein N7532_008995 [Penicillium argentinense]KAJ5090311.1 hypothetical protein N7532_008995 [Penicillium argentinense]